MNRYIFLFFVFIQLIFSEAFEGLTLISQSSGGGGGGGGGVQMHQTLLINNEQEIINSWSHNTASASVAYLSKDSILFVPSKISNGGGGGGNGPTGGLFKKLDWNNNILWSWEMPEEICEPHHDIAVLPNGNFLVICSKIKTQQEALDAGLNGINGPMKFDMVVEIQPINIDSASVIWEWTFWDHLVQDSSPEFSATYGTISNHPELLDINVTGSGGNGGINDWNHTNKISYNAALDQIVLSCRHMNEIFVIDHSTTTLEASGHSGGNQNKGGDILYRWGSPQNYGRGDISNQILDSQHGIDWIPEGYPGAGNFLLYNNNHPPNSQSSAVLELESIADENGSYPIVDNEPFGPINPLWVYESDFHSNTQSGAYRMPNGNTLITVVEDERIFEVNIDGDIQWEYSEDIRCARALKYGYDYFNTFQIGDINSDDVINILDVIQIMNAILSSEFNSAGDMNNDGILNVLDVIALINIILSEGN